MPRPSSLRLPGQPNRLSRPSGPVGSAHGVPAGVRLLGALHTRPTALRLPSPLRPEARRSHARVPPRSDRRWPWRPGGESRSLCGPCNAARRLGGRPARAAGT
eukprot:scaffold8425_cov107-Isochrysis_galbana.AAC.1